MDKSESKVPQYKYIIILAMFYVCAQVGSLLLVYRLTIFGKLLIPGSVLIYPFTYILSDVIAEVYGYKVAKLFIWISLICGFVLSLAVIAVTLLPMPHQQHLHLEDQTIRAVYSHLIQASLAAFLSVFIGSFINIYIITKWKILLRGRLFWLRSIGSTMLGEAIMIIIAGFVSWRSGLTIWQLLWLIGSDYLIRIGYAIILAFPATILVGFLKAKEGLDVYGRKNSFNPFSK